MNNFSNISMKVTHYLSKTYSAPQDRIGTPISLTAQTSKSSPLSGWKNIASGPRSVCGYAHSTGLQVTLAGASLEAPSGKLASDS